MGGSGTDMEFADANFKGLNLKPLRKAINTKAVKVGANNCP